MTLYMTDLDCTLVIQQAYLASWPLWLGLFDNTRSRQSSLGDRRDAFSPILDYSSKRTSHFSTTTSPLPSTMQVFLLSRFCPIPHPD